MDIVDNVANQFNLQELVIIAEVIGISPISTWGPRKLIDAMNSKLLSGFPNVDKIKDDVRPLFMDFLYVANHIDSDGQITESLNKVSSNEHTLSNVLGDLGIADVPDCFSYADDQDPACKRCPIFKYCAEFRISNLPPCYGHLYDETNPKCYKCMESALCKLSKDSIKTRQADIVMNLS